MTCAAQDVEDIHSVLSVMQKNLECPICLDLMKEPVATRCDHIFCRFCMLQLLSKKKKGRAQCPMCKKEITKRSLQESPRFKLLIDGLMKIINAFELDSGYKFFPSQEYSKSIGVNCKETQKEDDQSVVQSIGYRNRNKRTTVNGGQWIDHPTILDTDAPLARNIETQSCSRPKRQKKESKQLLADFASDSSEDDLFKKAGSLGDEDGPYLGCKSRETIKPEKGGEEQRKIFNTNDLISLKSEAEDVAASDQAEYGFSERDFESTRSHLLWMDGLRTLKEISSEKAAAETKNSLASDGDLCEQKAEQRRHAILDGNTTRSEHTECNNPANANMQQENPLHDKSQTLKNAIDYQYDKDDSVPEEMGNTQGSTGSLSCAVSRKRMKRSIQRVNEWLLKTTELLNASLWDEELLSEVFPLEDQDASDRGSCMSDETEIMTTIHPCVGQNTLEKTMFNVEDQVFGKVYKRKSNTGLKVTCVADIHVDSVTETLKDNEVPNVPSLKRKRRTTSGLQPEDFIKKVEGNELSTDEPDGRLSIVADCFLDCDKNRSAAANCSSLHFDQIKADIQDLETISDVQEAKPKKQKKSLKRKSGERTRTIRSLSLIRKADLVSCKQQTPFLSSELKIDSYPSSNEPGYKVNPQNVRRSRRLKWSEKPLVSSGNQMAIETNGIDINLNAKNRELHDIDPPNKTSTLISSEHPCVPAIESEGTETQITTIFPTGVTVIQNVTDSEIESPHPKFSAHLKENGCEESWHTPAQAAESLLDQGEMEDSDLDTQHLLKTFKSAKRMSFKLDTVTESADKENFDPVNMSDCDTNLTSGHQGRNLAANTDNLSSVKNISKSNISQENIQPQNKGQSMIARQPEHSKKLHLKPKKKIDFSSEVTGNSTAENTDSSTVHEAIATAWQLNDLNPIKETELHGESNQEKNAAVTKSEGLLLHSESESMRSYPVVTHESPAAVRRGDTKSSEGENKQAKRILYQTDCFEEEQVNDVTSAIDSQGSATEKILRPPASCNSSPDRSPGVYSDTPDGLLGSVDRVGEATRCRAVTEKSFVFDGKKSTFLVDKESPGSHSQLLTRRKRQAQKLESSSEESSEDEDLPCFNAFLSSNATSAVGQKNTSAGSSPKQQGGGVLAMFSSCSTSGKTQTSWNPPQELLLCSQESMNLFSSQSNTSDHSLNGTADHKRTCNQNRTQEGSPKRTRGRTDCNAREQMVDVENDFEEPNQEQNLDEFSGCESEASHTGDSSGLSSQCEILNTQQRDAMQNNLENLQREMAALEAVLEQHGTQSPVSEREQASTAEHVTIRRQEGRQKQTDHGGNTVTDTIPETKVQFVQDMEQPVQFGIRLGSPTPPPVPPQTKSSREISDRVHSPFNVFRELKESDLTQGESINMEQSSESRPVTQEPDIHNCAKAPRKTGLRSTPQARREVKDASIPRTENSRQPVESREFVLQQRKSSKHCGSTQRSSSPTFASPTRSIMTQSVKSPVVSSRRNFSIVASGLSQSELILVQKFARKTQSVFSSQMTVATTHVIMKTDEHLVCERTLKYFLGIAGRKWVVSYEWIVQSFREGRILDEYDFEVKGDVINGRNHRGPRRSRLGSDGLLLADFEICCLGSFKDLNKENLEWMVSLCGASVVNEPSRFKHIAGATSLVIVQPDGQTDYAAMRKKHSALVVTREWLLDSVASYKLQMFDSYLV
ncbi:breast cancer type 1 susceptibility protein [Mixophyes fleayi]|uniref:breast cancer type 1 susceptibility protein n=1 Tax=Mixophyes fleayi TaxID=3061075 RepID=UPI003F4DD378